MLAWLRSCTPAEKSAISQFEVIVALEQALRFCGHPFTRAALQAFVADAWALIDDRPNVAF